jgi:hypothetical protein
MTPARNSGTLGGMIDMGFVLMVHCLGRDCNRTRPVDLHALAEKYGRDHGSLRPDLVKLPWRCDRCGGRSVSFTIHHGGPGRPEMHKP